METVSIEKSLAISLLDKKLKILIDHVNEILNRWKYESGEDFIRDAKSGKIREAEDDAITLRHLYDQIEELHNIKSGFAK